MAETAAFHYRAFLSYSHRDTPWAKWLHGALEGYRIDKDLVGRETPLGPVPATLRPIFRDREDFSAGHSLTEQTEAALEGAQFMVVLCSPNAARSPYVNEEIRRYKALGRAGYVIPLIVDGEPGDPERECFPPAIRFRVGPDGTLTDEHEEPIAADARPQGDGKEGAKLKLVSGMLGLGLDEIVHRAERARRRRLRNWVVALSMLTVSFAGLAVWAEINRREANVQRAHAVAALDAATKTSNTLTFDFAVKLRDRAGIPAALVKTILDSTLVLQQQLAQSGQTSPALQASGGSALNEVSLTLLTVGDRAGAVTAADRARQIFAALAAAEPGNASYLPDFAIAYERLGEALNASGKGDEARADYQQSLELRQKIAAANPAEAAAQNELAIIHNKLGDLASASGDGNAALAAYQQSVAIEQPLVDHDPGNTRWVRELAVCYERLGDAQEALGRHDDALASFQKRLALARRLVDADAQNTEWLRDLAISYNKLGDVFTATHQFDDALKNYRLRLSITQKLVDSDPGNRTWQRDLAIANGKLGNALSAAGQLDDALAAYRTGLDLEQKLAATDAGNAAWQRDLFVSYTMIGSVLHRQAKEDDAIAALKSAAAIVEKLAIIDSGNAEWQFDLALASWQLATLGDDTANRLKGIVTRLQRLKEQNRLGPDQVGLLTAAQSALGNAPAQ